MASPASRRPFVFNSPVVASFLGLVALLLAVVFLLSSAPTAAPSSVIRTIPLRFHGLYPHSIAWDDRLGLFLSGSLHHGSVFTISDSGSVHEFIRDPDYAGMAATVGVAIDAARRRLLVVITDTASHPASFHGLSAYHLDTKERIFLARFEKEGITAGPHHVTLDQDGNAFVSDMYNNLIWKVRPSGDVSVFADTAVFELHDVDHAAIHAQGLNGITLACHGHCLLAVQPNSGKLFRVDLDESRTPRVSIVKTDITLVAADGITVNRDGMLVVISMDVLCTLKSRDNWRSAYVVGQTELDHALTSSTVTVRGRKDDAFVVHSHLPDLHTVLEKGVEALTGGELRKDFSIHEMQLPHDPDNDPLLLLCIPILFAILYAAYKLQMKSLFDQFNSRTKVD